MSKEVTLYQYPGEPIFEGQFSVTEYAPKAYDLDERINMWLDEKGKRSPKTARAYKIVMQDFRAFTGLIDFFPHPKDTEAWNAIPKLVWSFLPTTKTGKTISIATKNQRIAALKSFYSWCIECQYAEHNPLLRMKPIKGDKSPHAAGPLESEQVKAGLARIDTNTLTGKRDKTLLALLLTTSRRATEVRILTWGDLTEQAGKIKISFLEKGGDVQVDTLDPATQRVLLEYRSALQKQSTLFSSEAPIFCCLARNFPGHALSIQAVSNICKKYLGDSRIHVTRHTWAVEATNKGANVNDVRKKLGHATLAHTIKYLENKQAIADKYSDELAKDWGI